MFIVCLLFFLNFRTQVSFQNHQEVSILSRTEHNIELLLKDWDKRTSFVTVDASDSQRVNINLNVYISSLKWMTYRHGLAALWLPYTSYVIRNYRDVDSFL